MPVESAMANTSDWGFPKGQVAQTLRKIVYPKLTDHEVEVIVVCLLAHLLVENKLNGLLYRWLIQDAPNSSQEGMTVQAEDQLWKNIIKMDFAKKYSLIQPFFEVHFPSEAQNPWKLNDLRNHIFHGREIKDAKFRDQPISEEKTAEDIFLAAQFLSEKLDKFEEMIDAPHALAERWSKRLEEMGQRT